MAKMIIENGNVVVDQKSSKKSAAEDKKSSGFKIGHGILCIINLFAGESQIEVHLVLPWREYARIEYIASASWPLSPNK